MDASGGILLPVVCREYVVLSRTLYGCIIYPRREHKFCLFIARVFLRPKETDGQSESSRSFCALWSFPARFHRGLSLVFQLDIDVPI